MKQLAGAARFGMLLDLLYPPECVWCQTPADLNQRLCSTCNSRFLSNYYRCQKCAAPLPRVLPNADCSRCRSAKWRFTHVVALATYRGEMRRAVIMMKRSRFEPLRRAMAELLAEQLRSEPTLPDHPPLLIPVPYHWSHAFSTATNTAELLAQGIAARIGWPIDRSAVRRSRKTSKQGMLSWAERKINVRHAFTVRAPARVRGHQVWLVDDVMTSGATTAELARQLLRAGAAVVNVAVVARGTGVRESSSLTGSSLPIT